MKLCYTTELTNDVIGYVATVLTVYGIETMLALWLVKRLLKLQQYLPFTVLKLSKSDPPVHDLKYVATVLTVYGIETRLALALKDAQQQVATVLTVYGIETITSTTTA